MRYFSAALIVLFFLVCLVTGCGERGEYLELDRLHAGLVKKMVAETVVPVAWHAEQKKYSSLPESQREAFQDTFAGKKIRTAVKIKEYKNGDMTQFQKAFEKYNYYVKEKFNFNNLVVVIGNGPTTGGIETSYVVFLPQKQLFDFTKEQTIIVEGLVDNVSFTFYNCHILLYPARVISK